jgi:hypothetical protein
MAINNNPNWFDFLTNIDTGKTKTTSSVKVTYKSNTDNPLLSISTDKLFELYGNLVLAGFTEDEALIIIVGIANNATNR